MNKFTNADLLIQPDALWNRILYTIERNYSDKLYVVCSFVVNASHAKYSETCL